MRTSIVITPHVINTINSLPMEERLAVTAALAGEMILGGKAQKDLTPMQEMIFSLIKSYVKRDSERAAAFSAQTAISGQRDTFTSSCAI